MKYSEERTQKKIRAHSRPQPIKYTLFFPMQLLSNEAQIGWSGYVHVQMPRNEPLLLLQLEINIAFCLFVGLFVWWFFFCSIYVALTKDAKCFCEKWDKCNNEIVSKWNKIHLFNTTNPSYFQTPFIQTRKFNSILLFALLRFCSSNVECVNEKTRQAGEKVDRNRKPRI